MEQKTEEKSPDEIIEDLGGCGRYQMRMSVISHIMKTLICWSIMSIVIITKPPKFSCDDDDIFVNESSIYGTNRTSSYDPHQSCQTANGTKCTRFKFDDSIKTIVSDFDLVCDDAYVPSTIMSIQSAGTLVGNLLVGQIADLYGRKIPFFSSVLLVTISQFISLGARGWVMVAIVRFFIGAGSGAFMTTTYSLLCEFTLAKHRVWVIGFPSWPIETSIFCLVAWLLNDWRYMNLACALVGIPCLFAWWVIPESFRWYIAHGKQKEAERILEDVATVNKKPLVESKKLEEIAAEEENKKDQKYTILHMFRSRYLIRLSLLLGINWFGLGFVGYGIMFGIQALSGSIYLNLFLFSIVGIPAKGIAIWMQNRFGRKWTTIVCYSATAISCIAVGIIQNFDIEYKDDLTNGLALVANIGITMIWGSIQTMTIELYPTVIRNIGFGTLSVLGRIGSIIGPQSVFLTDYLAIPGLLYIACGVVSTLCVLALFGLPETKDSHLQDNITEAKSDQEKGEISSKNNKKSEENFNANVNDIRNGHM